MTALQTDYRRADLDDLDRAICDLAIDLTRDPASFDADRVARAAEDGIDAEMLHDVVQVASLFNYYNRLAEGLGVDDEPEWS